MGNTLARAFRIIPPPHSNDTQPKTNVPDQLAAVCAPLLEKSKHTLLESLNFSYIQSALFEKLIAKGYFSFSNSEQLFFKTLFSIEDDAKTLCAPKAGF